MQATLLKRIDALAGPLLARLIPRRRRAAAFVPQSILVIRPGGIGDAVLLIPALRALQAAYPSCRIEILAENRNAAVFEFCPGLHAVHRYDEPGQLRAVLGLRYDLVIDTEQWYRLSALVARLIRTRRSIGFATNERKRLFTDPVPYDLQEYEPFSFFRLLAPLGIEAPAELPVPFLSVPPAARERAASLLARLGDHPFVAIFPGASVPRKEWGGARFRQVAASAVLAGYAAVVVGGKEESDVGYAIARATGALNLAGEGSLVESAAVIAAARVLVTGDSGLLHIAAGLGTPTLSLFGPSDPRKWAPKGDGHRVFASSLSCAPCAKWGTIPPCTHETPCVDADPAEVTRTLMQMLRDSEP
ncbi:glycosyltransferase family 9 protein [Geomonas nitrogeniifigens]|uniref:Glycosyltransferase family 9 protein n=1 Tax=Geomonas diazotrophica TaxID=2843197 RepID=A0ABX8JLH4_9BACT|nr:glycosyltransferase family 9 protein [Geomonas nitrogeniifigens]QWV99230.1 glycosyltransferase family 9 protein [Geomonas nitrogeniifigens]QXE88399.1 glycosyltransferase family 9 protein [Geomonas nitrogeniifigens]